MPRCSKKQLQKLTQLHWERRNRKYERYINDLLPEEIDYAHADDPKRVMVPSCRKLVLLVGHAWEPLFQSIWAYRPTEVFLILSQHYGDDDGWTKGQELERLLQEELKPKCQLPDLKVSFSVVDDISEAVFKELLTTVTHEDLMPSEPDAASKSEAPRPLVIDITGAKKSMVSGAFLYAAYTKIPISYVNFDDEAFVPKYGKPYGYACRIGEVENPYQLFALRDLDKVRALYEQYNFREARALLVGLDERDRANSIYQTGRKYFPQDALEGFKKLGEILHCYELWDNGSLNRARIEFEKITDLPLPSVVADLGGKWPDLQQKDFIAKTVRIYESPDDFKIYACDELNRIQRLIKHKQDYRSALLRAANLNEVLIVIRLIDRLTEPQRTTLLDIIKREGVTPPAKDTFESLLIENPQSEELPMLSWRQQKFEVAPPVMNRWWLNILDFGGVKGWEKFLHTRNGLSHTFIFVPQDLAKHALAFASANFADVLGQGYFDDFEQRQDNLEIYLKELAQSLDLNTESLPWNELCTLCGLKSYLPISLYQAGKE